MATEPPTDDPACAHGPARQHLTRQLTACAGRLVRVRYPQAHCAVLGGSAGRGTPSTTSDLDVSVLLPDGEDSRREVVRHEGQLAEVFLNTRADLRLAFAHSRRTRRGTALFLWAESVSLHDPTREAVALRAEARRLLAAGPEPLTEDERTAARFRLTDLLDDLADTAHPEADRFEQLAVAEAALRAAAQLLTAHHGAWHGEGKWLPRRLRTADEELGRTLLDGHLALAESAEPRPLATAIRRVLLLAGGALREGFTDVRE